LHDISPGCGPLLRSLYLADTDVSDEGMKVLAHMEQLQTLDLSRTWVTDAGLKALEGLKQLRTLRVQATLVSEAGAAQLKKTLPEVTLER
jgi:hypothetical protein